MFPGEYLLCDAGKSQISFASSFSIVALVRGETRGIATCVRQTASSTGSRNRQLEKIHVWQYKTCATVATCGATVET